MIRRKGKTKSERRLPLQKICVPLPKSRVSFVANIIVVKANNYDLTNDSCPSNFKMEGFLKNIDTENEFAKKNNFSFNSNFNSINDLLLNFKDVLGAPEYVPSDKALCISRVIGTSEEFEESDHDSNIFKNEMKNNLLSILKKHGKEFAASKKKVKETIPEVESSDLKIPEIGMTLIFQISNNKESFTELCYMIKNGHTTWSNIAFSKRSVDQVAKKMMKN